MDNDDDGDGVNDLDDFFVLDPGEWEDTDLDGIGNNTDADDDNDRLEDDVEIAGSLDPLDPDTDGDGIMDGLDSEPGVASNVCVGEHAVFAGVSVPIGDTVTCAATGSVTVQPTVDIAPGGAARVTSPRTVLGPGFRVAAGAAIAIDAMSPLP